jgi:hypothetical protein
MVGVMMVKMFGWISHDRRIRTAFNNVKTSFLESTNKSNRAINSFCQGFKLIEYAAAVVARKVTHRFTDRFPPCKTVDQPRCTALGHK